MSSSILDILIAAGLLIGLARGLSTGAVRQIVGLAGTALAIVLALELMHPVGNAIGGILGAGAGIVPILGFIVVFAAVQLALYVLAKVIETSLKMLRLSMANRAAGAIVGLCKAALLLSVLFLVLNFFNIPNPENREASALYRPVAAVFPATWDFVAERFPAVRNLSDRFGEEVRERFDDVLPGPEDMMPEPDGVTPGPDEALSEPDDTLPGSEDALPGFEDEAAGE
ncbi:MAG: CvpA family protein [Bacteroidetes bacterium SB0662_bin_6]|nr:CvpA family protein [Bacteroidetes bacterium SB0668_bin_1]MYE05065.1 CvpA family protein [Bacteroidetes bacterium SB0662_bin_6]